ncbi:exo-beta-N-acetylmuramidase NamZ domain-containing protein, partial [uncultured Parabacteroides sp.]
MKTVFRLTLWLLGILFLPRIQAITPQAPLVLGAERIDVVTRLLQDKQVGLVVNQTSILEKQQKHLLDALLEQGIQVKKVFAPEHGFRGTADAGADIKDSRDLKTGIPIISIYGKNKKPTAEQLQGLDVIVFDIQDVGVRFYTYISTM